MNDKMKNLTEENAGNIKIAFLLVIYNNPEQANIFIRQLLEYEGSYVYIHVDSKSLEIIPRLITHERVSVMPNHFNVQWGDYSQIQANNALFKFASRQRHHEFYSLHSGVDMMVRPINELVSYLEKTDRYGYYECRRLPAPGWQYGGGIGRIALRWPVFFRKKLKRNSPVRYLRSLYGKAYGAKILRGRKLPGQYQYWGGSDWFTIREDCVQNVLKFQEQELEFEKLFYHSLIGTEIYYVSIFQMTKNDNKVSDCDSLRYVDWSDRGQILSPGSPNTIKMDFLSEIELSGKFFARKFDANVDRDVIDYFKKKTG